MILAARKSCEGKKEFLVEWKMRKDGFKPLTCFVEEDEMRSANPIMIINYVE